MPEFVYTYRDQTLYTHEDLQRHITAALAEANERHDRIDQDLNARIVRQGNLLGELRAITRSNDNDELIATVREHAAELRHAAEQAAVYRETIAILQRKLEVATGQVRAGSPALGASEIGPMTDDEVRRILQQAQAAVACGAAFGGWVAIVIDLCCDLIEARVQLNDLGADLTGLEVAIDHARRHLPATAQ